MSLRRNLPTPRMIYAGKVYVNHAEAHGWLCVFEALLSRNMWRAAYECLVQLGVGPQDGWLGVEELSSDQNDVLVWLRKHQAEYDRAARVIISVRGRAARLNLRKYATQDLNYLHRSGVRVLADFETLMSHRRHDNLVCCDPEWCEWVINVLLAEPN